MTSRHTTNRRFSAGRQTVLDESVVEVSAADHGLEISAPSTKREKIRKSLSPPGRIVGVRSRRRSTSILRLRIRRVDRTGAPTHQIALSTGRATAKSTRLRGAYRSRRATAGTSSDEMVRYYLHCPGRQATPFCHIPGTPAENPAGSRRCYRRHFHLRRRVKRVADVQSSHEEVFGPAAPKWG